MVVVRDSPDLAVGPDNRSFQDVTNNHYLGIVGELFHKVEVLLVLDLMVQGVVQLMIPVDWLAVEHFVPSKVRQLIKVI